MTLKGSIEREPNPKRRRNQSKGPAIGVPLTEQVKTVLACFSMRRAQAILLTLSLLAAPLALLARGNPCAERACCVKLCCLPHRTAAPPPADHSGSGMPCHHELAASMPAPMPAPISDCSMKSGCSHALDFGLASPLPLTVLASLEPLLAPEPVRQALLQLPASSFAGFHAAPFEPPRS
jgi:hypothetical protein